jgi:phosphoribosylformylglycinamidine synthase subunit PurS
MKAVVKVMLRKGVLDPQGKAIGQALGNLGFQGIGNVRQGKVIEIDLPDGTDMAELREMADKLLANPVTEDYEVSIVD